MNAEELWEIATRWSFWGQTPPQPVSRRVDLPRELTDRLCLVIQGVRRSGKSTLLIQMLHEYGLDTNHCVFLNFEDPSLANALDFKTLELLVDTARAKYPDEERLYFFLDEIQGVDGWERWIRSKLERPRGDVFIITGSNSSLLSGELGSVLTGRQITVELFPFDIHEARELLPDLSVRDFIFRGGFPEALKQHEGDRLLRNYFNDLVEKDVRERVGARSSRALRSLVQMVYESAGSETSLTRLAKACGIAVDTAGSYLEACEDAYLLFGVPYFAYSERKRRARSKKYYPIDTGLCRVVSTTTGSDLGKSLEAAVFLSLRRQFRDVSYWKGAREVDFIVSIDGQPQPIQVTMGGAKARHHKALEEFYEAHPGSREAIFVNEANFADLGLLFE